MPVVAESAALTHQPPAPRPWWARLWRPLPLFIVALLLLLGWQWWRLGELQDQLSRRLGETQVKERQTEEKLQLLTGKLDSVEAKLAEMHSREAALEALSADLLKNRDERLLAEAEQAVAIAAQQLQLAGNVQSALAALQSADASLARAGRVQFLPLRRLINRDIERLKALPLADLPGITLKLEGTIAAIDSMPLAFEQRTRPVTEDAVASARAANWWQGLGRDLWSEIRSLIRVERIDSGEPALLSPDQVFFLRENLKLRLVNARLALLQRDGRSFHDDLRQARDWLERYFDRRAKPVQNAIALLNSLAATDLSVDAPGLNETLAALRSGNALRPSGGAQR